MPLPPIPPGLERRLVDLTTAQRSSVRWTEVIAGIGAIAAAVIVAVLIARGPTSPPRVAKTTQPMQLVTDSTRAQETRPCDIFPPLPRPF